MKLPWAWRKPHYAWIMLASAMGIYIIGSGIRLGFGVVIDPLVEQYGWSRSAISFAYTLQFLAAVPVYLVLGKLGERFSPRQIVITSTIIFAVGVLLLTTIKEVWQFQLYWGALAGGMGTAASRTVLPVLLTRWFERRLGMAIGLLWAAVGLGPAIFSPLMRWAISSLGWREAFLVIGLAGGAVMLLCSFFIRNDPKEMKLTRYGMSTSELPPVDSAHPPNFSMRQLMVMTSFWSLVAIHAFGCVGHSIPLAHMVSMATFVGLPGIAAAGMLSIATATSIISRFVMSLISEARGPRFTLTLALLLQSLPIIILLSARELHWLYTFAFLFGIGYGGEMVGFPIFNRQYYGLDAPLNTIFAYQMIGASLGMATGGWLGGAMFDWTGSHTWSIITAVGIGLLGVIVAVTLPARVSRRAESQLGYR